MKSIIILVMVLSTVCLGHSSPDFTGDGIVDFDDFSIFSEYWLGDPDVQRFARTATCIVAESDSKNKIDADYVCDGTAHNVEIQAAIDALPEMGGTIHFLAGNYYIADTIFFNGRQRFVGEGIFTSKLQLSMPVKMFQWRGGQGGTEYFCEFDNLYLYGDSANLTGGYGIYTSRIDGCDLVDTRITRCYIDEFRDDAVTISSTWGWVISNAVIEHNRGYCIYALGGGELTISDCKLSGNRNNKKIAAVYLSSTNNLITNTQFERNGTDGLHLNRACDNGTVISNCTFIGNSEDSVDVSSDIYIYSNKGVLISNCFFDGECKAKHGVFVDSLADDVLIRGCKFMNHSSSHISDDYNKAIYTEQYYDTHMAVLVENDNYVHSAISGTGTEQEITEQITNPDVPRNITVTTDSSNGIITVWGIDAHGRFCSEVIEISASGTVQGMIAFATIDKITISKEINTTEAVEIGIGCKIGLSNTINEADDVFKVKKNNADIASYYVDTTYNTVEFHTIENGDELTIYYKSNLNIYD